MKSSMAFKGFFKGLTFLQFCELCGVYFLLLLCIERVVLLYAGIIEYRKYRLPSLLPERRCGSGFAVTAPTIFLFRLVLYHNYRPTDGVRLLLSHLFSIKTNNHKITNKIFTENQSSEALLLSVENYISFDTFSEWVYGMHCAT